MRGHRYFGGRIEYNFARHFGGKKPKAPVPMAGPPSPPPPPPPPPALPQKPKGNIKAIGGSQADNSVVYSDEAGKRWNESQLDELGVTYTKGLGNVPAPAVPAGAPGGPAAELKKPSRSEAMSLAAMAHRAVFGRGPAENDPTYMSLVDEISVGSKTQADAVSRFTAVKGEREQKAGAYLTEAFPRLLGRQAGAGDDLEGFRSKLVSGELGFEGADAALRKSFKPIEFNEFAKSMQGARYSDIYSAYQEKYGAPGGAPTGESRGLDAEAAAEKERLRLAKQSGRRSTILTSGRGVQGQAPTAQPSLLGRGRGRGSNVLGGGSGV